MGIEVGKSSGTHQSTEKVLPPRLNLCPRASYSSLSSPGTSPSGSSVSSQDSAFSQISEHSVFTPTETSSPIDCTFQAQRKQEDLSSDFDSPSLIPGMPGPSTGPASSHLAYLRKGSTEQPSQMHSVTLHPSAWLRSGLVTLKNWSLKKKTKASRPEDRKVCSLKEPLELPPCASGTPEADSLPESQDDIHLRVEEGPRQTDCGFSSSQDSGQHASSPFRLVESRLKPCRKLHEGEETGGQCPCEDPREGASSSLETAEDAANPGAEPTTICDDGGRHLTKDPYLQ
ncbi:Rho GTPase-activating protein 20 [Apodemus speciosus]|uniref:Rho GTPase-activating protein 20 n=1 Tax=Apodemus speciosus TaxID=105296 RepID=A0ABQ0F4K4_APOSI